MPQFCPARTGSASRQLCPERFSGRTQAPLTVTERPLRHVTRATQDKGKGSDWQNTWRQLKKSAGLQDASDYVTRNPNANSEFYRPNRDLQKDIRRQERMAVNLWSSAAFLQAGAGVAVLMIFIFVFVVGPPSA
uniref:Uncharacterized protein n=1 Tax=Tetraselmis sp. GSL018 TaxID=582737 RepID=A0A061S2S2_9CHLO